MSLQNFIKVFDLYLKYGDNGYIGEEITQLEHATQAAFQAEEYCDTNKIKGKIRNDLILGALLHDIGHLIVFENKSLETMGDYGVMNHENIGAKYLGNYGFNDNICEFVSYHIRTKRYLITKNPEYYNKLSGASKKTFEYQGGKLSEKEMEDFENNPLFQFHLKIREFDDKAKSTEPKLLEKIKKLDHIEYYGKFIVNL